MHNDKIMSDAMEWVERSINMGCVDPAFLEIFKKELEERKTKRYTVRNGYSGSLHVVNMECNDCDCTDDVQGFSEGIIKFRDDRIDYPISVLEITHDGLGNRVYQTDEYKVVTFELPIDLRNYPTKDRKYLKEVTDD